MSGETGESLGAAEGVSAANNDEAEVIFNMTFSKNAAADEDSVSDGGDHCQPIMKSELGDLVLEDGCKSPADIDTKRNTTPSKGSSKRKRKNRRRREKKAAAIIASGGYPTAQLYDSDVTNTTGTENSHNSEDVSKGGDESDELGTDVEMMDVDLDSSSLHMESQTPAADGSRIDPPQAQAKVEDKVEDRSTNNNITTFLNMSGPTHSVESLLQFAKNKIIHDVLGFTNPDGSVGTPNENSMMTVFPSCIVPPSSPSSAQHVTNANIFDQRNQQKSFQTQRAVHFDEGPPVIHSAASLSDGPSVVKILDIQLKPTLQQQAEAESEQCGVVKKNSTETIVIAGGNVGAVDSATSSVASTDSTRSLLKGTGSSCEDVPEGHPVSYHYPSREIVEEDNKDLSTVSAETYREIIQVFKTQNPEQTKCLEDEVDNILDKSMNKFNSLMERCSLRKGDSDEPVLLSYKPTPEKDDTSSTQQQVKKSAVKTQDGSHSLNNNISKQIQDPNAAEEMNTTFIISNEGEKYGSEESSKTVEQSLGEPSAVAELESSRPEELSVVFEVDDEDLESTANALKPSCEASSSETSTVVEAISVQYIPSSDDGFINEDQATTSVDRLENRHNTEYSGNNEEQGKSAGYTEKKTPSRENQLNNNITGRQSQSPVPEAQIGLDPSSSSGGQAKTFASVELLTLHFPTSHPHPASGQDHLANFSSATPADDDESTDVVGGEFPHRKERGDRHLTSIVSETESDCPWTPQRAESLTKVFAEREKVENAKASGGQLAAGTSHEMKDAKDDTLKKSKSDGNGTCDEDELEEEKSSRCGCVKMCVMM